MIFRRSESILFERLADQTLVFDPEKNLPYVLNEVAAYILMNTDGRTGQDRVAERVCETFDVGFGQALEDWGEGRGASDHFSRAPIHFVIGSQKG